jgi:hypothetical protein
MPEIHVTISSEAEVKVEARGTVGAGCTQLTRAIEKAIGTTTGDVKKSEFYQQANQAAGQQAAAGR